ncbi:hypothetical protein CHARACLAT_019037 [Characodon lateralis]|uniref:Uncharacterized protein n=1 Tax=Characodon lateralis TaxID=208331 RepID=A0ABU7E344_9TELE|nr:hypothetical protein [Characodon lateralis]
MDEEWLQNVLQEQLLKKMAIRRINTGNIHVTCLETLLFKALETYAMFSCSSADRETCKTSKMNQINRELHLPCRFFFTFNYFVAYLQTSMLTWSRSFTLSMMGQD